MESIAYIASDNCQEKLLLHLIVNFAKKKKAVVRWEVLFQ